MIEETVGGLFEEQRSVNKLNHRVVVTNSIFTAADSLESLPHTEFEYR